MPFWKKGEDPWDWEPEKPARPAEPEDGPSLMDELRDWNAERKEENRQREATPPPMACPWCGGEMQVGWIPGKDIMRWWSGVPTAKDKWLGGGPSGESHMTLKMEGGLFGRYLTAWHCETCRKLVVDTTGCDRAENPTSEEINRRIIYGTESERTNNEGENDT